MFCRYAASVFLCFALFQGSAFGNERNWQEAMDGAEQKLLPKTPIVIKPEQKERSAAAEALQLIRFSIIEVSGLVRHLEAEGFSDPAELSRAVGRAATALVKADLAMLDTLAENVLPAQYDFEGAWNRTSSNLSEAYENFSFESFANLEQRVRSSLFDSSWDSQSLKKLLSSLEQSSAKLEGKTRSAIR